MEFLYIDESGDNGFAQGSSEFFILAGISIESKYWKAFYWKIDDTRKRVSQKYGLIFDELKGNDIFTHRGPLFNSLVTSPNDSLWIYRQYLELICDPLVNVFIIQQSKQMFKQRYNEQQKPRNIIKLFNEWIWMEYLSMYEGYLLFQSNRYNHPLTGMIYCDTSHSQQKYIRKVVRRFSSRINEQSPISGAGIVEDVIFRDSKISKFIQLSDILAFSISRILTGRGKNDEFEISPNLREKLLSKVNEPHHLVYKKALD